MKTIEGKSRGAYRRLMLATFLMYVAITAAKNVYVAEKTTLVGVGSFGGFAELASTLEYYFYSYAITQILLIFFINKLNIKWYLALTIGASAVTNILMAFTGSVVEHWVIYIINGALQAGIWGSSIKILTAYLPSDMLADGNRLMSSGSAVSTAFSYAVAAVFGDNWRLPFILFGIIIAASVIFFVLSLSLVGSRPKSYAQILEDKQGGEKKSLPTMTLKTKRAVFVFYLAGALMSVLVTGLHFFLFNNLDVFLKQIGGFDNTVSKMFAIIAPVVIVIGPLITIGACQKHNFVVVGTAMFTASLLFCAALWLLFRVNIVFSVIMFLCFVICTNGGRMIPVSIIPMSLRESIDSGLFSVITNSAGSVAAGLAPKLLALIIDREGLGVYENWHTALFSAFILNLLIVLLLVVIIFATKRLFSTSEEEK